MGTEGCLGLHCTSTAASASASTDDTADTAALLHCVCMAPALPLQELFPGSDVARMIELAPGLFLESPWPQTQAQLEASSSLLRRELAGAEVDFMFQVSKCSGEAGAAVALRIPAGRQAGCLCFLSWAIEHTCSPGQASQSLAVHCDALPAHPCLCRRILSSCSSRCPR